MYGGDVSGHRGAIPILHAPVFPSAGLALQQSVGLAGWNARFWNTRGDQALPAHHQVA